MGGGWYPGPRPGPRSWLAPSRKTGTQASAQEEAAWSCLPPNPAKAPTELSPLLSGAAPRPYFPALHVGRRRWARARGAGALAPALVKTQAPEV